MATRRILARVAPVFFAVLVVAAGCEDDPELDTSRDTAGDPLGDVVLMQGEILATNHDRSGHAGSQVDLLRFTTDGTPVAATALDINGMGYLAACTDGSDLYLQAGGTGQLFRLNASGEIAWTRSDPRAGDGRLACGVVHATELDSFLVVYRAPATGDFTMVRAGPGFDGPAGSARTFDWPAFGPDGVELVAVAWHQGRLWGVGQDGATEVYQAVDPAGQAGNEVRIAGSDAPLAGLTSLGDDLLLVTAERQFIVRTEAALGGSSP